jgi:hypothetical protein
MAVTLHEEIREHVVSSLKTVVGLPTKTWGCFELIWQNVCSHFLLRR